MLATNNHFVSRIHSCIRSVLKMSSLLTVRAHWVNSADSKLMNFFFFLGEIRFLCRFMKTVSEEMFCMQCQTKFSWKRKQNFLNFKAPMTSAADSILKYQFIYFFFFFRENKA